MDRGSPEEKTDCDVKEIFGLNASYLLCNLGNIECHNLIGYPGKLL